ncbi:hypothetical protein BDN71DRAFT_1438250 [Pleurotus eryngii]|uniref:Transmembrane protein n=1 Tax=Pleurotus eryngii TaxID=5323 RepID=A0A9P6A9C3_PLEER|nr:hypothetical protein BDN71DRAFT_1438250 [Pleurotus eryngii]
MPILTTTIEDPCPLILYSTIGWKQGSSESDDFASSYSQSSFTATNTQDSSVSFSFNGTAVEIFGAKRDNHGDYQITIDNVTSTVSGFANPNVFKTSLFSVSNLTQGFHTITLTNKPTDNRHNFVDIDSITWKSRIGGDKDNLIVKTYQDTDPSFSFSPSDAWSNNPDQLGLFNGGSGHQITGQTSASLTYSFAGDGVQLFGPIGPLGAPYTVQVDGGPVRSLTSVKDFYTPQMMLFHADNLGDGKHVLRLEYQGSFPNQTFAIDYANVINASSMKSSRLQGTSAPSSRGLSGGLVAVIVVLVLLIVACIIAFFLIMRRRWYLPPDDRKLSTEGTIARPPSPPAPSSYYTGYTSSTNRNRAYGRGNGQRGGLTRGNTISSPSILTFTSFDPSVSLARYSTTGRSYYTRSEGIPEEPLSEPSVPYATVASSLVGGEDPTTLPNRTRTTRNVKGQTVLAPGAAGAGRGLPAPPIVDEPQPTRSREVEERQSQFYSSDIAPPDYHQATDPSGESCMQDVKGVRSVVNR